ncbi:MAG: chorismate mutase [Elusimicrobia bacterium]|nr:chorismate mutase [Elusimicrobiota bacterium]
MTPAAARRSLTRIRSGIDRVDDALVRLLGERRRLVLELAKAKRVLSLPIHDRKREQALVARVKALGRRYRLNTEFVEVVFRLVVMNSKEVQYHEAE